MGLLTLALGASAGTATTVVAAPVVLGIAGFTGVGISAFSIASSMMSAGPTVAVLQSAGVVGIPLGAQAVGLFGAFGSGAAAVAAAILV